MLNLEDFMNIRDLKQQGWSVSAIAGELHLDRKTVRKHLLEAPQPYKRENPAPCKIDPYRPFLRERWEKGVHNARKLRDEIRLRGYDGGYSQLKLAVVPWREEGRERAFVRFETGPGEQIQMDWGHFELPCYYLLLFLVPRRQLELMLMLLEPETIDSKGDALASLQSFARDLGLHAGQHFAQ
jgi:transposase